MPQKFRERDLLKMQAGARSFGFMFDVPSCQEVEITSDGIAILRIEGPLEHHAGYFWDSYESIVKRYRAAIKKDDVRAVVLKFDSPGGDAGGVTEASRKMLKLKGRYAKPVYAYSGEACYSAAYELACAADEIIVPDTGGVGSIGVIAQALDVTEADKRAGYRWVTITTGERKGDGNPHKPLSDEAEAAIQERIDHLGAIFFDLVARARGMKPKDVAALEAGLFLGQRAVDVGLADGVMGWDDFLSTVRQSLRSGKNPDAPAVPGGTALDTQRHNGSGSTTHAKDYPMGRLALQKALNDAKQEALAAMTPEAKSAALDKVAAASAALAAFDAKAQPAPAPETQRAEEPEDDDDDDADSEEEDDEESAEEEDDEEEASAEEQAAAKALAKAEASLDKIEASATPTEQALRQAKALVTTKRKALVKARAKSPTALVRIVAKMDALLGRVEAVEKDALRRDRNALIDRALSDRRISPAEAKDLRKKGMAYARAFIDARPKALVRTTADALQMPGKDGQRFDPPTQHPGAALLETADPKVQEQVAAAAGMTVEELRAKTAANIQNGAGPSGVRS